MKRVILGGLIVAAAAVGGSALAADAYDDTGAWYLAPMGQYTFLDKDRISNNHAGYQIGLGYNFAPNFALEAAISNGSFKISGSGASEKLQASSLDLLYKFLPVTSMVRPYIIGGTGAITDNVGRPAKNNTGWLAEAGAGVLIGLGDQTGSTRVQFRTEAKYRYEFMKYTQYVPNDPRDLIVGVGFQFMFGAPTPTPPPPPPPPPPPVVRELPPPPPPPPPAPVCQPPAGFQMDADCHIIQQKVVVRAVDFEYNSTNLTLPARQTLDNVAAALMKQPELQVEIQGYTDSVGSVAYNLNLSQKRAESVKAYVISKGVSSSTLTAKGYGKAGPIASNSTEEGRAQNRRVEFDVTNTPAHVKVETKEATDASTDAAKHGEPERVKKDHQ
ncbi:MAG: OmpA family protein [Gammaproteobacteria bacterium]